MNRKHLIALSIAAFAGSGAVMAQQVESFLAEDRAGYLREYGIRAGMPAPDGMDPATKGYKSGYLAESRAGYKKEYGFSRKPADEGLTRAEVLADLHIWREAGMDEFVRGESRGFANERYRNAKERYEELRVSPRYDMLVEHYS